MSHVRAWRTTAASKRLEIQSPLHNESMAPRAPGGSKKLINDPIVV